MLNCEISHTLCLNNKNCTTTPSLRDNSHFVVNVLRNIYCLPGKRECCITFCQAGHDSIKPFIASPDKLFVQVFVIFCDDKLLRFVKRLKNICSRTLNPDQIL